jgi:uncharacterized membrane protein YoaK (UPF0700 family)
LARPAQINALDHLWPMLAFVTGIMVARLFRREAVVRRLRYPLRYVLVVQVLVLAGVGLLPPSAPQPAITTSIGFAAALQFALFREVRSATVIPVTMTGNLMRTTDAVLAAIRTRRPEDVRLALLYTLLVSGFGIGAVVGALLTAVLGTRAVWVPAVMLLVALALFFIDEARPHPVSMDEAAHD